MKPASTKRIYAMASAAVALMLATPSQAAILQYILSGTDRSNTPPSEWIPIRPSCR